MPRVWVLDTSTKGTGATMVPLESTLAKPGAPERPYVPPKPRPRPTPTKSKKSPKFKVVDVMSGNTLTEGADGRATIDILREVRSVVDVRIYVSSSTNDWRLLTLEEQRRLWKLR
jgi:hypothetical protein